MPEKNFGRTLVIRGGALGDFLLTLPVLRALRETSAHLEILGYPSFVQLAREGGLVHAGRSIEYGPMAGFFARGAVQDPALRDYFGSFDIVLSYLYDPDGIFAGNLQAAGARRIVQGPHKPAGQAHAIDELSAPLRELAVTCHEKDIRLSLPATAARRSIIALHPGSGSRMKNWAAANWHELAGKMLAAYPQARLAVIGGEADQAELESLASLRRSDRVEFWENLPLPALARNLGAASGYIGHDTGISHLAAVLGVPSLLLFGPTDPAVWAPPHGFVQVLRAPGNDLSQLELSTVFAAAGKCLAPRLLASD